MQIEIVGFEDLEMTRETAVHIHAGVPQYFTNQLKKLNLVKDIWQVLNTKYGVKI